MNPAPGRESEREVTHLVPLRCFVAPHRPYRRPRQALCPMFVAAARITIHLPYSHSLKDKRQVVRSLISRLHNTGNLAAAEVGTQDKWQLATIGIASVTNEGRHADALVATALAAVERYLTEGIVTDVQTEIVSVL